MSETKEINIEISQGDFEDLRNFKQRRGLTWEGVLKYGVMFSDPNGE